MAINLNKKNMKTQVELITPGKALEYLQNNTKNRKLNQRLVLAYAEDMKKGNWKLTAQGISFSENMTLIDGQHRLAAIVKSNISQHMNVTYGLNFNEVFAYYDTHKGRSAADVLTIENVKYSNVVAGIIKMHMALDLGKKDNRMSNRRIKLTNDIILDKLNENKQLYIELAAYSLKCSQKTKLVTSSFMGGIMAHLIITKKNDKDKVYSFFNEFYMNKETSVEAVKILRNIIINDVANRDRKMPTHIKLSYFVKVWNAYITNDDYKVLRLTEKDTQKTFI